jgi:D-serine deaminase-like pyridoxal phosphate-dependent protein
MQLTEVDTPALLIDLDAFECNVAKMAALADKSGMRLRPHSKTHKSPVIALKQIAAGAVGVCCQKVAEAEAMVSGGVKDVLVTNEIVGTGKLRRLMELAKTARVGVCVDNASNVAALAQAASDAGVSVDVLVEVDVGGGRCGVQTGEPVLELARAIVAAPGLRFAGLHAYHGSAQHIRRFGERGAAIAAAAAKASSTRDLLQQHGIACESITGAGTGSFGFEIESGVHTELQAGSYVFMDADYRRNLNADGEFFNGFEQALYVYVTVMSRPAPDRAIVDAGLKALAFDSGMPQTLFAGASYVGASDEHGNIVLEGDAVNAPAFELGQKLKLIPGHCDPTVNLHNWFVCYRGGRVEAVWPVAGRGPGF